MPEPVVADRDQSRPEELANSLFAAAIIVLYLGSTFCHALPTGQGKRGLQIIEHSAIYLLIAGTYSPLTLGVLRGG